jgi:predicted dehydrogenase
MNFLLDAEPTSVEAWGSRHAHPEHTDVAYLRMEYAERGVSAHIHVSWLDPCKVRRVTAVGSKKMAVYDDLAAEERIRVLDKGVDLPLESDDLTQPPMSYRYGDIVVPFISPDEPLALQDRHFIDCVATGARPLSDGEDGVSVVETLEAAELSRKLVRPVLLGEITSGERFDGARPWDTARAPVPGFAPQTPAHRDGSWPLLTNR